jgi:CRP-like cAMP-binding protein
MAINTNLRIIQSLHIFADLGRDEKHALAEQFGVQEVEADAVVMKQGDLGSRFYVVKNGMLRVDIDGMTHGELQSGDSFGELALITDHGRAATVTAKTPCTLFFLEKARFDEALASSNLGEEPPLWDSLCRDSEYKNLHPSLRHPTPLMLSRFVHS